MRLSPKPRAYSYVRILQSDEEVLPAGEVNPSPQSVHVSAPRVSEYFPSGHVVQPVLLGAFFDFPSSHEMQEKKLPACSISCSYENPAAHSHAELSEVASGEKRLVVSHTQ